MLAYEMDGKPLSREHGAPLRLVIPEMYGYKGVKWLEPHQPRAAGQAPATGSYLGYDRDAWVGHSNGYGSVKFVRRFSRTERTLHWVNAAGFLLLLGHRADPVSAAPLRARRAPPADQGHPPLGRHRLDQRAPDRHRARRHAAGLLRTARDLEVLRPSRLNVGQKMNAILNAAFALLFLVSGLLLWFGERDTTFRFTSTVLVHDILMYAALTLLVGHLYLALIHPATRHSLRGMTRGTVREDWAELPLPALGSPAGRLRLRPAGRSGLGYEGRVPSVTSSFCVEPLRVTESVTLSPG